MQPKCISNIAKLYIRGGLDKGLRAMFHIREFGNPPTYEEIAGAGAVKEKEDHLGMYNSWFHTEALMENPRYV